MDAAAMVDGRRKLGPLLMHARCQEQIHDKYIMIPAGGSVLDFRHSKRNCLPYYVRCPRYAERPRNVS